MDPVESKPDDAAAAAAPAVADAQKPKSKKSGQHAQPDRSETVSGSAPLADGQSEAWDGRHRLLIMLGASKPHAKGDLVRATPGSAAGLIAAEKARLATPEEVEGAVSIATYTGAQAAEGGSVKTVGDL